MDFQTFHDYNHLVQRKIARPLVCPTCGTEVALVAQGGDEPLLHCYLCSATIKPGLDLYDKIRAVVREFEVD